MSRNSVAKRSKSDKHGQSNDRNLIAWTADKAGKGTIAQVDVDVEGIHGT